MFDLGIRSSIVRYVAKYSATDEQEELNRLVNTAMFSYTGIGVVAMAITLIAAYYVNSIFRIHAEFVPTAHWLLLMVGAAVSLGFPLGVFGGILEGLQRFYLLNLTTMSSTLIRALLIVIALQHGRGLLTVALITVSMPLVSGLINAAAVFRHLNLRFGLQHVSRSSLRRIASYSGTTFMIIVAGRLRFKTDAMVIGTMVSAAAVTYFTIGSRLVDYASEVVSSLAQIFVPMSSQSQAKGDLDALRKIFVVGNRACAFIIFPITAILTVLGKSVIEAWVGPKYVSRQLSGAAGSAFSDYIDAGAIGFRTHTLGNGKTSHLGVGSASRGHREPDLEHRSSAPLRNYGRRHWHRHSSHLFHDSFSAPSSLPPVRDQTHNLSLSRVCPAYRVVRPASGGSFTHATLVCSASLASASGTTGDSWPGIRARPRMGVLDESCLGCGSFGGE